LLFVSHIGHNATRKEEKETQNMEQEIGFEKEYILRSSSAE
jgi:hypothetical protein